MPVTPALMPAVHQNRLNRRRAIMTNDPRRLSGIDMRTSAGRRYRDIVDQLAAEFGAVDPVALRELAGLRYTLEQTQAAVVAGDASARSDLVRVSNLIARRERELRESSAVAAAKRLPASLEAHLARRSAEKAIAG
jgi:hypothetical protein